MPVYRDGEVLSIIVLSDDDEEKVPIEDIVIDLDHYDDEPDAEPEDICYKCYHCGGECFDMDLLRSHIRRKHIPDFHKNQCPHCCFRGTDQTSMKKHFMKAHPKLKILWCPYCHFETYSPLVLESHVKFKHFGGSHFKKSSFSVDVRALDNLIMKDFSYGVFAHNISGKFGGLIRHGDIKKETEDVVNIEDNEKEKDTEEDAIVIDDSEEEKPAFSSSLMNLKSQNGDLKRISKNGLVSHEVTSAPTITDDLEINESKIVESTKNVLNCSLCSYQFKNIIQLKKHIKIRHNRNEKSHSLMLEKYENNKKARKCDSDEEIPSVCSYNCDNIQVDFVSCSGEMEEVTNEITTEDHKYTYFDLDCSFGQELKVSNIQRDEDYTKGINSIHVEKSMKTADSGFEGSNKSLLSSRDRMSSITQPECSSISAVKAKKSANTLGSTPTVHAAVSLETCAPSSKRVENPIGNKSHLGSASDKQASLVNNRHKCEKCELTFTRVLALKAHVSVKHNREIEKARSNRVQKKTTKKLHKCLLCKFTTRSPSGLKIHFGLKHTRHLRKKSASKK